LSIDRAKNPEVKTKNEGIRRQWIMHANDSV